MDELFVQDEGTGRIHVFMPPGLSMMYETMAFMTQRVLEDTTQPGTQRVIPTLNIDDDAMASMADTVRSVGVNADLDRLLATVNETSLDLETAEAWLRAFSLMTSVFAGQLGVIDDESYESAPEEALVMLGLLQASAVAMIYALDGEQVEEYNLTSDCSTELDPAEEAEADLFAGQIPDTLPEDFS